MKTCKVMLLMKPFCFWIDMLHICFLVCELKIIFWWSLSVPGDVSLNPYDFFLLDFKYFMLRELDIHIQQCVGCKSISMGNCFITWRRRDYNIFLLYSSTRVNFVWVDRCLQVSKGCYVDLHIFQCVHTQYFSITPQISLPFPFSIPTSHAETHCSNKSFSLNLLKFSLIKIIEILVWVLQRSSSL